MERINQPSDLNDAQAVIAAMQLLMRSLQPAERETLLSTFLHEQDEAVQGGDTEQPTEGTTELEQSQYPIQPLTLDTQEDDHATSSEREGRSFSESHTDSGREVVHESGSLVRYEKAVPSVFFFQPWAASFPRRRWWGYMAASVIFMLTLTLSTLVSYKMGMQAGMTMNEQASCFSSGQVIRSELQPLLVMSPNTIVVGGPHLPASPGAFVSVERFGVVTANPGNWVYAPGMSQCSEPLVYHLIIQAR
jgi:hypothetical protein